MQKISSDYELLEELGSGRFGVVFKSKSRATGELYAVKTVNKTTATNDAIERLALKNEPKALTLLSSSSSSSSHITRLHSVYDTPTHLHLVLDYCPHPTLLTLLTTGAHDYRLPEHAVKQITLSLLAAVHYCHRNGVAHRDIKPENIFVNPKSYQVKLCDFGAAGLLAEETMMTEVVGTPYYMAPEVLQGGGYCEKVDVWSVGVVVYEMIAGIPPFYGDDTAEVFQRVLRGNLMFPVKVFGGVSLYFKDFLRNLLRREVSRRFSTYDALRHPWLESVRHATTYTET